ncbi:3-phosphoshikimate 1-carboxyvinyltransferase [Cruoricaptor ignavus]|uniref:3-phosphoshikimate 1-carboxyvinyltransferase n=1 Tax=Cruoricaptor ignavus TaxID=1118202 RepID=A0A1M6CVP6_9FLAO|nr:3-phosphoshikimate 1-carboxyvinyltransferase [Cruoricaptor ignavus]SHI65092.1 3-phosphoshikimate 1-carboxyvinyltransferase [Cruoricaptor ignavus]
MSNIFLPKSKLIRDKTLTISGSKSESNRLLILQKLYGNIQIENLSDSQDTQLLQSALGSSEEIIDIHHAGTAMRFLTSFFAIQESRTTILTGSERMKQRPVKPLVEALLALGAEIYYLENPGFPPLKIVGKKLKNHRIKIDAGISSQFISSLMMIGGKLENGLEIELLGEITSKPYLEMTLNLLTEIGIESHFENSIIRIFPAKNLATKKLVIESDWSSASYFYSACAIGREKISLRNFKQNSLQGDAFVAELYKNFFGIKTEFSDETISLIPTEKFSKPEKISLDMNSCPDIVQTLCATASAMKIPFEISGLKTLKIKETDRLSALKNELEKIGCITEIGDDFIKTKKFVEPQNEILIETYDDHRMAMSFAPYCLAQPLTIENQQVIEKSYPKFWQDFAQILSPEN